MAKKQTIREANLGLYGPLILESILQGTEAPTRRKYAGVRINFATWLGREPSSGERVTLSRTITRLEGLGLVSRLQGRRLVLTKAGKQLADNLAGFPAQFADAEMEQILNMPIVAMFLPDPKADSEPLSGVARREETASPPNHDSGSPPVPDQGEDRQRSP